MTVANEMEGNIGLYNKMVFVEFLEFIGRISQFYYRASSESLYLKIEKVLD